jgi:hypothetical protein
MRAPLVVAYLALIVGILMLIHIEADAKAAQTVQIEVVPNGD